MEIHAPAGARPGAADVYGIQGQGRFSLGPYLEFIARVTSHIPDKGQFTVICLFLTSIRDRQYHPFAIEGIGAELLGRKSRATQKRNFLSLPFTTVREQAGARLWNSLRAGNIHEIHFEDEPVNGFTRITC
jgi:hypothetical protein